MFNIASRNLVTRGIKHLSKRCHRINSNNIIKEPYQWYKNNILKKYGSDEQMGVIMYICGFTGSIIGTGMFFRDIINEKHRPTRHMNIAFAPLYLLVGGLTGSAFGFFFGFAYPIIVPGLLVSITAVPACFGLEYYEDMKLRKYQDPNPVDIEAQRRKNRAIKNSQT